MDALATPVFKSILFATLMTAGVGGLLRSDPSVTRRLALHAEEEPNAVYLTAWRDGDVEIAFPDSQLYPITFYNRARINDGCRWLGIEKLTPLDDKTLYYEYSEVILECDPGARPYFKTPRTGLVTVEE